MASLVRTALIQPGDRYRQGPVNPSPSQVLYHLLSSSTPRPSPPRQSFTIFHVPQVGLIYKEQLAFRIPMYPVHTMLTSHTDCRVVHILLLQELGQEK